MKFCAECAHWQKDKEGPGDRAMRRCDALERTCFVFVDAWNKSGIFTAPTFGCVLWKAAPNEST